MTSVLLKGLLLGAFSFSASASEQAPVPVNLAAARKRMPATAHVSYSAVLTFKKGESEISASDRAQLDALFAQIKGKSQKIEQAHVAAWGDQPVTTKGNVSAKDRELADSRADVVDSLLEHTYTLSSVEMYNMSERGNYFARALSLPSAEVKKLFASAGAPQTVTAEDFALVKAKGGVSRAVVLIEVDPVSVTAE